MKKALILQGGTMRGAFLVGALKIIYEKFGNEYFDLIISSSVGVHEQAFFASGQIYNMENTWREYVDGRKLINIFNPLKGKEILDLDYLIDLFQSDKSLLDINKMAENKTELLTFVTNYETLEPELVDLKSETLQIMKAACALPFLFRKPVYINNKRYFDGYFQPDDKFNSVLIEKIKGYDTIAISVYGVQDKKLLGIKKVIKPTLMPLWGALDTNKNRIIKTIKQGEIDTKQFIDKLL